MSSTQSRKTESAFPNLTRAWIATHSRHFSRVQSTTQCKELLETTRLQFRNSIEGGYNFSCRSVSPNSSRADLVIVVEDHGDFYRASTCLTLDMACNNAKRLAR